METETAVVIEALANKLGVATNHIIEVFVSQARVDFIASTFQYIILFVLLFGFYKWVMYFYKNHSGFREETCTAHIIGIAGTFIFVVIGVCMGFSYLPSYIASLFNPEYWAFERLFYLLQSVK